MKINFNIHNINFKSGYPTFNSAGHLSCKPGIYDLAHLGFKPYPDVVRSGLHIDYLA